MSVFDTPRRRRHRETGDASGPVKQPVTVTVNAKTLGVAVMTALGALGAAYQHIEANAEARGAADARAAILDKLHERCEADNRSLRSALRAVGAFPSNPPARPAAPGDEQ